MFFITTRADYKEVNKEHLPYYLLRLKENAQNSTIFAERLVDITGFNAQEYIEGTPIIIHSTMDDNFEKLFASGFAKWLLKLMLESRNKWKLEMLDSYWYRVEDNQSPDSLPNMLSLAFKISPIDLPLTDSTGLAISNPSPEINEESLAIGILDKMDNIIDLDRKIDEDSSLYNALMQESLFLLKTARYPADQYIKWAEQKRIRFPEN